MIDKYGSSLLHRIIQIEYINLILFYFVLNQKKLKSFGYWLHFNNDVIISFCQGDKGPQSILILCLLLELLIAFLMWWIAAITISHDNT